MFLHKYLLCRRNICVYLASQNALDMDFVDGYSYNIDTYTHLLNIDFVYSFVIFYELQIFMYMTDHRNIDKNLNHK